jgi:DNA repair protein RadC
MVRSCIPPLAAAEPLEKSMIGFREDAPIEEIVAVMDDATLLALAASLTKQIAKAAIREFGSIGAAVAAPVSRLIEAGLDPKAANRVKAIEAAIHRVLRGEIKARDTLCSQAAVLGYLRGTMAFDGVEQFRVLFLDKRNHLIADEVHQTGTVDHTPVYPREIAKRALQLEVSGVVLAHNHPSGDPTPSHSDIQMTKQIVEALKVIGINVLDHLIIGRDGYQSLKQLGYM